MFNGGKGGKLKEQHTKIKNTTRKEQNQPKD